MKHEDLMALTGQESGIVIYRDGDGRETGVICNWSAINGLPRVGPLPGGPIMGLDEEIISKGRSRRVPDIAPLLADVELIGEDVPPADLHGSGRVYTLAGGIVVIAPDGWN